MSLIGLIIYSLGCIALGATLNSLKTHILIQKLMKELEARDKSIVEMNKENQKRDPWRM